MALTREHVADLRRELALHVADVDELVVILSEVLATPHHGPVQAVRRQVAELLDDIRLSERVVDELDPPEVVVVKHLQQELGERVEVRPDAGQQRVVVLLRRAEVSGHGAGRQHRQVPVADLAGDGRRGVVAARPEEDVHAAAQVEVEGGVDRLRDVALRVGVPHDETPPAELESAGVEGRERHADGRPHALDGEPPRRHPGQQHCDVHVARRRSLRGRWRRRHVVHERHQKEQR